MDINLSELLHEVSPEVELPPPGGEATHPEERVSLLLLLLRAREADGGEAGHAGVERQAEQGWKAEAGL